jgi:D-3-phosphoglycerate dehydrogenase
MPPTVLVTSRSFSSGDVDVRSQLIAAGVHLVTGPTHHRLPELQHLLSGAVAWIAGTGPITASHIDAAPSLRLIARYGVGVDSVDLEAARRRNLPVTNTPGANSAAVAEHTIALLLAALRMVTLGDRGVRSGDWGVSRTRELRSLTIGIVGFGRIGRRVARALSGFGSTIIAHDPLVSGAELREAGVQPVSFGEVAARSDIVSLHLPGNEPLVDRAWLRECHQGLILVNTARASLVDESALALALAERHLSAYAADTLSSENGDERSPLLAESLQDRTIFTPHCAAQTIEAVDSMGQSATTAVLAVLRGDEPANVVN